MAARCDNRASEYAIRDQLKRTYTESYKHIRFCISFSIECGTVDQVWHVRFFVFRSVCNATSRTSFFINSVYSWCRCVRRRVQCVLLFFDLSLLLFNFRFVCLLVPGHCVYIPVRRRTPVQEKKNEKKKWHSQGIRVSRATSMRDVKNISRSGSPLTHTHSHTRAASTVLNRCKRAQLNKPFGHKWNHQRI